VYRTGSSFYTNLLTHAVKSVSIDFGTLYEVVVRLRSIAFVQFLWVSGALYHTIYYIFSKFSIVHRQRRKKIVDAFRIFN